MRATGQTRKSLAACRLQQPLRLGLREGTCLAVNAKIAKRWPVGPTEKNFDPGALARSDELVSYRF